MQWQTILDFLARAKQLTPTRCRVHDESTYAAVLIYAAMHNRSLTWGVENAYRIMPSSCVPSQPGLSRHLRKPSFMAYLNTVLRVARVHAGPAALIVDAKGFPISHHSNDSMATFGPCAGRMQRGYKLHTVIDTVGNLWAWHVAPMHLAEQAGARILIDKLQAEGARGLLLADKGYDSIELFELARQAGLTLVAPRRVKGTRLPTPSQSLARYRSFLLTESTAALFRGRMPIVRDNIERYYASLASGRVGLFALPPWSRTLVRVRAWIAAKLIIQAAIIAGRTRARIESQRMHIEDNVLRVA